MFANNLGVFRSMVSPGGGSECGNSKCFANILMNMVDYQLNIDSNCLDEGGGWQESMKCNY